MSSEQFKHIAPVFGQKLKVKKLAGGQLKKKKSKKVLKTKPTTTKKVAAQSMKAKSNAKIPLRRIGNVENFVVVWLDANINESDGDFRISIAQLRRVVNSIETFIDIEPCIEFINKIKDEKVFLIVSGSLGQRVVYTVESLSQVDSIYVFCGNKAKHELWARKHRKIKGVFIFIEEICNVLKQDILVCDKDLTSISIYPRTDRPICDINELDPSFMYSQLLKETLLEIEHDDQAKQKFIAFCRTEYAQNKETLAIIDEFEQKYPLPSPIWWFTRECFLYLMLNKALRTQNIEITIKMGFFIRDLHRQIKELHSQSHERQSLIVYRGQGMENTEFEKMKGSVGGLLSFNIYLSTTFDRRIALDFARRAKDNPNVTPILFQMEIDPLISSTPFASLISQSYFKECEQEVLFSMHTVFRINSIKSMKEGLWKVELKLTSDNDEQLRELTECMREETQSSTGWHRLASLMIAMGQFDKAEEFYRTALETTPVDNWQELAYIHQQLGRINDEKNEPADALLHYEDSLEIKLNHLSPADPFLVPSYIGIGSVLQTEDDLEGALEHFQHALDIVRKIPTPEQLEIATIHNYIGGVLKDQGQYAEALENYNDALKIRKSRLPFLHPLLAITYNNIGLVHASMNDHQKALSYYQNTLEIERRCLPSNHRSLGVTHNNIAITLECLYRYREAVEHQAIAVDIARAAFEPDHPQVQRELLDLARLRAKL